MVWICDTEKFPQFIYYNYDISFPHVTGTGDQQLRRPEVEGYLLEEVQEESKRPASKINAEIDEECLPNCSHDMCIKCYSQWPVRIQRMIPVIIFPAMFIQLEQTCLVFGLMRASEISLNSSFWCY